MNLDRQRSMSALYNVILYYTLISLYIIILKASSVTVYFILHNIYTEEMSDNIIPVGVNSNSNSATGIISNYEPTRTPGIYMASHDCCPMLILFMCATSDPTVLLGQGCVICQCIPIWHFKWQFDIDNNNSYTETCCFGCSEEKAIRHPDPNRSNTFTREDPMVKLC